MENLIKHVAEAVLAASEDLEVYAKSAQLEARQDYIKNMLAQGGKGKMID